MKTCLVVDDSRVVRKVARKILEDLEFVCTEAEDGKQARQKGQTFLVDFQTRADPFYTEAVKRLHAGSIGC